MYMHKEKREGGYGFFGKKLSIIKFDGHFFSVYDMGRQNILRVLYALNKLVFVKKKIM